MHRFCFLDQPHAPSHCLAQKTDAQSSLRLRASAGGTEYSHVLLDIDHEHGVAQSPGDLD